MFRVSLLSVLLLVAFGNSLYAAPPAPAVEQYVVMDFNDSVLHDSAWRDSQQPAGTVMPYVAPKGDSGADTLQLGVGQGRGGSNALEVVSNSSAQGLPGFWVIMGKRGGGNVGGYDGYLLPRGKRANRIEYWIRFESGYRAQSSAAQPAEYPNHQNKHFGTYHHNPSGANWSSRLVETNNWHFYYQMFLRHDQAQDQWIHVVLNESPNHQRSESGGTPNCNTTLPRGNFWELITRFYIDPVAYFSDPQKAYPVKMWVDDIVLSYVPDPLEVTVDIIDYVAGHPVKVAKGVDRDFVVRLKNNAVSPISGRLSSSAHYSLGPELLDSVSRAPIPGQLSLNAGELRQIILRVNPATSISDGFRRYAGLSFVPDDQFQSDAQSTNRSFSDANVERRWQSNKGPYDGTMYCDHLELEMSTPGSNQAPDSLGGITCSFKQGTALQSSLSGLDPDGDTISYQITRQPTQGTINLNPASGAFTYNAGDGFQKYDFFWYRVSDTQASSEDRVVWLVAGEEQGCNLTRDNPPDNPPPRAPANLRRR